MSSIMKRSTTAASAAYKQALALSDQEVTRRLIDALGGTLVSVLAGAKDTKAAHKWAREDGAKPRDEAAKRLRFAYDQWNRLSEAEGEHVARVWFIGANPWLEYDTPIQAIREGQYRQVGAAVQALLDDSYSG
ncbi:hypothetical protein ACXR2T_15145 [Leucobacter sp. HY1910]